MNPFHKDWPKQIVTPKDPAAMRKAKNGFDKMPMCLTPIKHIKGAITIDPHPQATRDKLSALCKGGI